ncbi:T6SS effector amidase Tae4 family protein [Aquimarina sp. RZ0]|uniref:T6SS effector amidase Tae4 family protein n=1 Tax=Aquimarina sp. RZ0 TaxID=2607730 RepID=UPI00165F63BB|nr:T6SS effector amidase Tae4 family protein [Aquimarina sp. RZ0]
MPNRNLQGDYRYAYQGQEKDPETGKPAFELRLYDPRINRWLTTDPAGQFHSPYMSMGNNWVSRVDPDGGYSPPTDFENTQTGEKVHVEDGIDQTVRVDNKDWGQVLGFQDAFRNGNLNPSGYSNFINARGATPNLGASLPSFSDLESNYPKYGRLPDGTPWGVSNEQFGNTVGGRVEQNIDGGIFNNTCACRVSHSLNLSGANIPYIQGQTSSNAGKTAWYIFRVTQLEKHLTATYGPPNVISSDISNFSGYKGVIIFDTGGLWSDASGHGTLWNGSDRLGGNYPASYYLGNGVGKLWITN